MTDSGYLRGQAPMLAMLVFIAAVQVLALALMPTLIDSGARAFDNPGSTANPIMYIILVVGFTFLLLVAMKLRKGWIVRGFILLSVAMSLFFILAMLIPPVPALVLTGATFLLLRFYPEWYIIDALGILICGGISALFGISMTTLPALLLLAVLAVYDAISVYKTKHMVALAEGVINIKAPLLFVVPKEKGYSFRAEQVQGNGKGAYFLGLGDAIIPTVLAISANWSLASPKVLLGINLPALGAIVGTYIGFLALLMTSRDKPQAGLPFLNGGTILGFLIGCAIAGVSPI
jgi:presenilin-like A22 family membrane protease